MSLRSCAALLVLLSAAGMTGVEVRAQQANIDTVRRAKIKVEPVYPELARKMNLSGTVKVEVVVAPNGSIRDAKIIGGHPVLAGAALEAVKKWKFEPGTAESSGVVDIKFEPRQ
ncbi:MAG: energy transducer TonB [Candidatus Sulfotelmatobacter sp.]